MIFFIEIAIALITVIPGRNAVRNDVFPSDINDRGTLGHPGQAQYYMEVYHQHSAKAVEVILTVQEVLGTCRQKCVVGV